MKPFKEQTVSEYLFGPCSRTELNAKALYEGEEKSFWKNAQKFVEENGNEVIGTLTFPQRNWLIQIKESLE